MGNKKRIDMWTALSFTVLALFVLFLLYPLWGLLRQAVVGPRGGVTLEYFSRFFEYRYYSSTIINSLKVSSAITIVT
ncbi:MAG: iron ABC transporter permease, partial [Firmicutes bacterium]|nr:iron ABC transporter permease [Bacillota bacterium]